MKRKNRLKKGVESIKKEIEMHKEKMEEEEEEEDKNLELAGYYYKEIEGLEKTKERKEKQLDG